ncbi:hypothetical protein, partial [Pararhizobium sp.]|uniref:hypothetical protein n=1 Tax=Pararhizobium sp. TaxID=1977563 RepID=UPI0027189794
MPLIVRLLVKGSSAKRTAKFFVHPQREEPPLFHREQRAGPARAIVWSSEPITASKRSGETIMRKFILSAIVATVAT